MCLKRNSADTRSRIPADRVTRDGEADRRPRRPDTRSDLEDTRERAEPDTAVDPTRRPAASSPPGPPPGAGGERAGAARTRHGGRRRQGPGPNMMGARGTAQPAGRPRPTRGDRRALPRPPPDRQPRGGQRRGHEQRGEASSSPLDREPASRARATRTRPRAEPERRQVVSGLELGQEPPGVRAQLRGAFSGNGGGQAGGPMTAVSSRNSMSRWW